MGAKEDLLADLIRSDPSSGIRRFHEQLVGSGLKFKGPKNSQTLFYFFRKHGKDVGVAAIRSGIFSFPASFWRQRAAILREVLADVPAYQLVGTQGFISSSQYSCGQISINSGTLAKIEAIIRLTVIPAAQSAGANIT